MKITSTRIATEADAKAIAELANEHELSIDSKAAYSASKQRWILLLVTSMRVLPT